MEGSLSHGAYSQSCHPWVCSKVGTVNWPDSLPSSPSCSSAAATDPQLIHYASRAPQIIHSVPTTRGETHVRRAHGQADGMGSQVGAERHPGAGQVGKARITEWDHRAVTAQGQDPRQSHDLLLAHPCDKHWFHGHGRVANHGSAPGAGPMLSPP